MNLTQSHLIALKEFGFFVNEYGHIYAYRDNLFIDITEKITKFAKLLTNGHVEPVDEEKLLANYGSYANSIGVNTTASYRLKAWLETHSKTEHDAELQQLIDLLTKGDFNQLEIELRDGVNELFVSLDGKRVFKPYYGKEKFNLTHNQHRIKALKAAIKAITKG